MGFNYTVGSGRVYLGDPRGAEFGERYAGPSSGFSFTMDVNVETVLDSVDGVLVSRAAEVTRATSRCSLTLDDISDENLGFFMLSPGTTEVAFSTEYVREFKLARGNVYDLGARAIRSLTATTDGAPFNLDALSLDGETGLLTVPDDADVFTGQHLRLAFIGDGVTGSGRRPIKPFRGSLRYVEDNIAGSNRVLHLPSVVLYPDGTLDFKTSAFRTLEFRMEVTSIPQWVGRSPQNDFGAGTGDDDFGAAGPAEFIDDYGVLT